MLQEWNINWVSKVEVVRPAEADSQDTVETILVFQSNERARGIGVRNCFEYEAKVDEATQGPTLYVRRSCCGLPCCMSMRSGIRHCKRDERAEFTFTNLPDAEYEEEKDPQEAVLETRSAGILQMQRVNEHR